MNKKQIFILLILLQLIAISLLSIQIHKKKNQVLGTATINPISKSSISINTNHPLKFFWEPKSEGDQSNFRYKTSATYSINPDTLNEIRTYSEDRPENTHRIITMGDSFTFGLLVDTKDNWTEVLEEKLNKRCNNNVEVINIGAPGYDIQHSIERFNKRGKKYNPDLIIWLLKDEDFLVINEIFAEIENRLYDEMKKSGELEKEIKEGNPYPASSKAIDKINRIYGENNILDKQKAFLEEFVENTNSEILFIIYPHLSKRYKKILNSYEDRNTEVFEISSTYAPEFHFPNDAHPNEKGHQLIAKDLEAYLLKNKQIICQESNLQSQ